MTTAVTSRREQVAHLISEVLAPIYQIFALLLIVGVHAAGLGRGLLLGVVAAFFAGGLPYLVLILGVRSGRFTDRHLSNRQQRPPMMVLGLVSVAVGLALMVALDAPRELYALVVAMAVGVAVALGISTVWKISIHAACTAGSLAVTHHVLAGDDRFLPRGARRPPSHHRQEPGPENSRLHACPSLLS